MVSYKPIDMNVVNKYNEEEDDGTMVERGSKDHLWTECVNNKPALCVLAGFLTTFDDGESYTAFHNFLSRGINPVTESGDVSSFIELIKFLHPMINKDFIGPGDMKGFLHKAMTSDGAPDLKLENNKLYRIHEIALDNNLNLEPGKLLQATTILSSSHEPLKNYMDSPATCSDGTYSSGRVVFEIDVSETQEGIVFLGLHQEYQEDAEHLFPPYAMFEVNGMSHTTYTHVMKINKKKTCLEVPGFELRYLGTNEGKKDDKAQQLLFPETLLSVNLEEKFEAQGGGTKKMWIFLGCVVVAAASALGGIYNVG